jgi:hypothetical protein
MSTDSLFICTPSSLRGAHPRYVESMVCLAAELTANGIGFAFATCYGGSVGWARDWLASTFLESPLSATLLVDDDMRFEPSVVLDLINEQKPFIGCAYPERRMKNPSFTVNLEPDQQPSRLMKASFIGLGLTLVRREVFGQIMLNLKPSDVPTYRTHVNEPSGRRLVSGFFLEYVRDGSRFGEDAAFADRYRRAGGTVWVLAEPTIEHWDGFRGVYRGSLLEHLRDGKAIQTPGDDP